MTKKNNPFHRKSYRKWFLADTFLEVSLSTTLATSLLIIDATKSVSSAGIIMGAINALGLIAVVLGGGFADLISRRSILKKTIYISLLSNLTLSIILIFKENSPEHISFLTFAIIILAILAQVSLSFANPALDGALKKIISPEEYPRAMSATQARSSALSIAGSPATGWLYSMFAVFPFALRFICESIFLVSLSRIKENLDASAETGKTKINKKIVKAIHGYKEGIIFLSSQPALSRILICAPLVNAMVFTATTWTIYYLRDKGVEPSTIGFVSAGFAAGGIVGSSLTPFITDRVKPGILSIYGLGMMVILFAIYFCLPHNPINMFTMAILCMLPSPALNAGLFSYVFRVTPDELQGRTIATFSLVAGLATVITPLASGWAVSTRHSLILGVLVCSLGLLGVTLLASSKEVRGMGLTRRVL